MGFADRKINSCLNTCKTALEWKSAYNMILSDIKEEIEAEKGLEDYIVEALGKEALDKFLVGVEEPLLNHNLLDTYKVEIDSHLEDVDLYRCNFLYMAYLYRMTESRGDKLKKNIVKLLGEEAYERLCYRGEYDKEVEFQNRMNGLDSEDKKIKLLVDYLTGRGVFSNNGQE